MSPAKMRRKRAISNSSCGEGGWCARIKRGPVGIVLGPTLGHLEQNAPIFPDSCSISLWFPTRHGLRLERLCPHITSRVLQTARVYAPLVFH